MRPVRLVAAVSLAAAMAIAGCSAHTTTAVGPAAAAPIATRPPAADPTPTPVPTTPWTHPTTPTPTTPPAPPPPPRPASCRTAQLQLRSGQIEGAMGSRFITYGFRNRSAVTCTMFGFPGVRLLDAHRGAIPTAVGHGYFDTGPARLVRLRPGGWAFFTLQEHVVPRDTGPDPCQRVGLAVTPPNQRQALIIRDAIQPCENGVAISPVRATGDLTPIS
jgi:hypothetical protein